MFGQTVGTILVGQTSTSGYLIQRTNQTLGITEYEGTRVFHVTLTSGSGTISSFMIANGSTNAGLPTIVISGTSGSNRTVEADYGVFGHTFPMGAYWTSDANLIQAAIICKADKI